MSISAYLNIFDDWDILPQALACIDPIADEIVVVDGAYDWIAPVLGSRNAARSRDPVYDALAPYSHKLRVINATWADEAQKRQAGYDACKHRYVLRFDADELVRPDEGAMDRFFASDKGVSQLEMPQFITPDFRMERSDRHPSRQGALFDKHRISAAEHLSYLWLLLPKELALPPMEHIKLHDEPFAFAPHLTSWRTPATSLSRARFYHSLYIKNGNPVGWIDPPEANEPPLKNLQRQVSSADFDSMLLGSPIVAGPLRMSDIISVPNELTPDLRELLVSAYQRYMASLIELNEGVRHGRVVSNGGPYSFDITLESARVALGDELVFEDILDKCSASIECIYRDAPYARSEPVDVAIDGHCVRFGRSPGSTDHLQRTLVVYPYKHHAKRLRFSGSAHRNAVKALDGLNDPELLGG